MTNRILGVSIVITSYNYGRFLGRTIQSARIQDAPDLEIVIVDNASTDDSWAIIEAAARQDARIRAYRNETNIGMIGNHVRGLELAQRARVLFLSADDYLLPGHDTRLVEAHAAHPEIDYFYTSYVHVDEADRLRRFLGHVGHLRGSYFGGRNEFADLLTYDCYACTPTTLFDREELVARGGFDPDIICGDYDTYLRLSASGARFGFLDVAGAAVRIHAAEITGEERYVATGKQFLEQLALLERYLTEENLGLVAGREQGVMNMLLAKMHNLRKYPDVAEPLLAREKPRIDAVVERLNRSRSLWTTLPLERPLVSVILSGTDDHSAMLETIDNLSSQTYANWELIVVINASQDIAPLLQDRARNLRAEFVFHRGALARAASLNDGVALAAGAIVAYADTGASWPPEHLARVVEQFERNAIDALVVPADAAIAGQRIGRFAGSAAVGEGTPLGEAVPLATVAHRRALFDILGRFDESLGYLADVDFVLRLFTRTRVGMDDGTPVTLHVPADRQPAALRDPSGYVRELNAVYQRHQGNPQAIERRREHLKAVLEELNAIASGARAPEALRIAEIVRGPLPAAR